MQTSFTIPICEDRPCCHESDSAEDTTPTTDLAPDEYREAIATARGFHELLIENPALFESERRRIARKIAGLLFLAESRCEVPAQLRLYLSKLHADADHRAGVCEDLALCNALEILDYYDQLALPSGG